MTSNFKTMLLGCGLAVAIGFVASISHAQTTGPASFAVKQAIKEKVIAAMHDGKISQNERRDILLEAKDVCSETEYLGLVHTMNRLSPPDHPTPENLGYAKYVDKQMMANFPSGDLPYIDSLPSKLPIIKDLTKRLAAKDTMPQHSYVVKETVVKQPVAKKSTQMQSVVKTAATAKPSVAKAATSKQNSTMEKTPKQTTAMQKNAKQSVVIEKSPAKSVTKSTKPTTAAKVVILPQPTRKSAQQSELPTANKAENREDNKISKSEEPAPPLPNANKTQPRNDVKVKTANRNVVEGPNSQIDTEDQVSIQQPNMSWKNAEKAPIRHTNTFTDYSLPVLTTPAAAFLTNDNKTTTIQASFDDTLEPESRAGIVR